jgi:tryptophan synthase beta chain
MVRPRIAWYNLVADLPTPPPPVLHPGTLQPVGPDDLAPLFPMSLIQQEVSAEREIEIPEPVREVYRQWRPSRCTGRGAGEGARHAGAHLLQVRGRQPGRQPQAEHGRGRRPFYNKEAGVKRIATETGAGQWGSSLAFAGALFGIDVEVYMVRVSTTRSPTGGR